MLAQRPRPRHAAARIVVLALLFALVAACGGSDGDASAEVDGGARDVPATDGVTQPEVDTSDAADSVTEEVTVAPDVPDAEEPIEGAALIETVEESAAWMIPGLREDVQVLVTEAGIPHIYASDRHDLAMAQGFILARDRFVIMDLGRRLGLGTVSELIGDPALDSDIESRLLGMRTIAERIEANLSPEFREIFAAFAAGVNAYIDAVRDGRAPAPSELKLGGALLGSSDPAELMKPWTSLDVSAAVTVVIFESSFHTGDVGRTRARDVRDDPDLFAGAALEGLRRAGAREDVFAWITPARAHSSAEGLGRFDGGERATLPDPEAHPGARATPPPATGRAARTPPTKLLERLQRRMGDVDRRLRRGPRGEWGSNVWAVAGSATPDGAALLAGDGHLALDIPSIFYQIGLDTRVLGEGDIHQMGLAIMPGLPMMAVGTNGKIAWSQTQLTGDVTDFYAEELKLDAEGLPASSRFQGEWRPLVRVDERFDIVDLPALGSEGRVATVTRWETFDGRRIVDVEGRAPAEGEAPTVVLSDRQLVAEDSDGDGVISAVSFDYAGFDLVRSIEFIDGFGRADDVESFLEVARGISAASQNIIVADSEGHIAYTVFEAVPCRGYLERDAEGRWTRGSHPLMLLDGARYGAFEIPTVDGELDFEAGGDDPYRCVIPFEAHPLSVDPPKGYLVNANNDPGQIATDNSFWNDPWFIGGPWDTGYRADLIERGISDAIDAGEADVAAMARVQATHTSALGEQFSPWLRAAIERGRAAQAAGSSEGIDGLLAALYAPRADAFDEVDQRLGGWGERGYTAASGLETFYHQLGPDEPADAVATMIFNAWLPRFSRSVWDDEGLHGGFFWRGDQTRIALLERFLRERDGDGAPTLASHNEDTGESAFFDVLGTDEVETSDALMLRALGDALEFLSGPSKGKGKGGFGTDDMDGWIWGARHQVRFQSLLAGQIGDDPRLSVITAAFDLDTRVLPLTDSFEEVDLRRGLKWFPRPGDNWGPDAANVGFSGTAFTHGSGPVMRMVIALKDGRVWGQNVVPGGQSALIDSPHFSDQARLWLANEAVPLRFHLDDVVDGAVGRERLHP